MAPKASTSNLAPSALIRKQKADAARHIQVATLPQLPKNSIDGLPATLDVERFAQARSFEIGAMQSAMKTATEAASHRVWQTLPRHLRRRAASHDVRRVPVRLREKAKLEIDPAKRKKFIKLLKRKRRLASGQGRAESFAKRQQNKTWLETHLWHAKRMHMLDIWGHRLAERPTAKSYRPSHRAAVHGSTLSDVSYMATVEVVGKLGAIITVLKQCCDLGGVGPWAARYTSGARVCQTHMYGTEAWPRSLIGPAMVFWKPEADSSTKSATRALWIRIHPATLKGVLSSLRSASKQIQGEDRPEITDLSGDINAFELVGPRTSQVIHGALKLAGPRPEVKQFWKSLMNARSPGNFASGMIIGLTVHDPRLNYPPTNSKVDESPSSETTILAPDPKLAQSEIWEQSVRDKLRTPTYKKGQLDRRRSENLVPGTQLRPTASDDKVPLLLIQHTISHNQTSLTTTNDSSQALYGWTVILPPSWSMPFLSSLTHTGTRVVGLSARHHQRLETKSPHFPNDYVGCSAYTDMITKQAEVERAKWERTPKGKRINYEALGTTHPWVSNWHNLVGGSSPAMDTAMEDLVPTDRASDPSPSTTGKPWLFQFPAMDQLVRDLAGNPEESIVETFATQLNSQRIKRGLSVINAELVSELFNTALVAVHVNMHGRGNPQDRAILYGYGSDEVMNLWKAAVESPSNEVAMSPVKDLPVLGYITSGGFSLQLGHGHGIAVVSFKGLVEMAQKSQGKALVRVRNLNGTVAPLGSVTPV